MSICLSFFCVIHVSTSKDLLATSLPPVSINFWEFHGWMYETSEFDISRCSVYSIFTYMWLKLKINAVKYAKHGASSKYSNMIYYIYSLMFSHALLISCDFSIPMIMLRCPMCRREWKFRQWRDVLPMGIATIKMLNCQVKKLCKAAIMFKSRLINGEAHKKYLAARVPLSWVPLAERVGWSMGLLGSLWEPHVYNCYTKVPNQFFRVNCIDYHKNKHQILTACFTTCCWTCIP